MATAKPLRIAQYGTKHGHAEGKIAALRTNPRVACAGVYEPDPARRAELQQAGWPWQELDWYTHADQILHDPTIVAVAAEGRNDESLAQAEAIIQAGKHLWYDKPAGMDWPRWQALVALAEQRRQIIQIGYMFRYHPGFQQIATWAQSGVLGPIYAIQAHMSTWISPAARQIIAVHPGGIFYDLAGHMIDQIVGLLGRPTTVHPFFQSISGAVPGFEDNTLVVLSYPQALANISIAAIEAPPPARRFAVFGERGSAILEPFEPATSIRLCLIEAAAGFQPGEQQLPLPNIARQALYDRELATFVAVLAGEQAPERSYAHDLLVQETLLRATGQIADSVG